MVGALCEAEKSGRCTKSRLHFKPLTMVNANASGSCSKHCSPSTSARQQGIRRLAGIYNSSNTEVAPTSCSNRKFLNDLVIWMAEALLKSRPVLPHDHFKHFRGNIPLTAGTLAKNAPRLLEDWSWYPLAFFGLLLWHALVLATIGTAFCATSNQLQ